MSDGPPGGNDRPIGGAAGEEGGDPEEAVADLRGRLDGLRSDLASLEEDVKGRTVHRSELESDLRRYVRARLRRGHARGWGPYLVLLYGTVMTLGAFFFLSGGWAILAMVVIWLSTLGLYALMLIVGAVVGAASIPGRAAERIRSFRR